jgi:Tfp pilus assembly protein PilO
VSAALKLDFSPRALAAALLAAAVVIVGAGWFVAVAPKHDRAANLQASIQADQARLDAAARAKQRAAAKAKEEKRLQAALGNALPDDVAMPQIVDQLNALAIQAGVTLDTITPAVATAGNGYEIVPLQISVDGHFFAVEKFLQLVRNQVSFDKSKLAASGRLFDVSSMQLAQTGSDPMLTATFQMNAYYYAPGASVAPPPSSTTDTTGTTTSGS